MLHSHVVVHRYGVFTRASGVQDSTTCHTRQVGITIHRCYASVVVSQYHLCQIYICNGHELHIEVLDIYVTLDIIIEAVEVAVDFLTWVVCREERFRFVERTGVFRSLIAGWVHRLVGISHHSVQRCLFIDVQALHTTDSGNLVPHQEVPVAPVEASIERSAVDGVCQDAGVRTVLLVTSVVAAQVEHRGLHIAYLTKDGLVGLIPVVVPFSLPVVANVVSYFVVPIHFEVQFYYWQ